MAMIFTLLFSDSPRLTSFFQLQYLKLLIWLGIASLVWLFPRIKSKAKRRYVSTINWWALTFAFIFIMVSVGAGLIDGLGKSPYSHTLKGIINNVLLVGTVLICKEFVRSYLVNSLSKKEDFRIFITVALIITISDFSLSKFKGLTETQEIVQFMAKFFLPELAQNIFATYLAFLGGPIPPMLYMGLIQGFHWLSPILPDLQWITAALVGSLVPLFALMAMQYIYATEAKIKLPRGEDNEGPLGWMVTSVISIAIVWFSVGVFPVYPSVVATGSMEPMIHPGDIILVRKIKDINEVNLGDVIQFQRNSILISHRIIDIVEEKRGLKKYRTKGDNNSGEDFELVEPQDIRGKIVQVVPKLGFPTLLLKSRNDLPLDQIEF